MITDPDFRIAVIDPGAGPPMVEPKVLHISKSGGRLRWAVYSKRGDIGKIKIEIEGASTITFPHGDEQPVTGSGVPKGDPFPRQGVLHADIPTNQGQIGVLVKYSVVLLTSDDDELERVDPYIVTDRP